MNKKTRAVLLHRSSDDTKDHFPFDYELRVIYTLDGNRLKTEYEVKNLSDGNMYFSIGAHEGYSTPEGIEEYDIIFDEDVTLATSTVEGNLLSYETEVVLESGRVLPLCDDYFEVDALVFKGIGTRAATLRNKKNGRCVRVEFPDAPNLLLWHVHGAPFLCIEPWDGLPDMVGSGYDISKKDGIRKLAVGKTYVNTHIITFS